MNSSAVEARLGTLQSWMTGVVVFAIIFAISVVGIMMWQAYRLGDNARQLEVIARETHNSLCAFKNDLQVRHDNGVKYLKDNPRGLTSRLGEVLVSSAQIQQSLDNQQATLDALAGLDCP